jgi:predicted RNase H-like nuclease (RuvC/YqgF family)
MTTTDQLRKEINELKDEIVNLKRTNDNYEKQLNKQTSSTGTVEWTTTTTWITENKKQISAIQSQIAEKDALITLIAKREIMALEVQRAQATAEKEKEGGTIVLLFFFSFFYTHVCF